MNETKWTPGPWHTCGEIFQPMIHGHRAEFYQAIGIGNGASHVGYASVLSNEAEAQSNARLISKAPEMAEALAECDNLLTHDGPCQCCPGSNEHGHDERCLVLTIRALLNSIQNEGIRS